MPMTGRAFLCAILLLLSTVNQLYSQVTTATLTGLVKSAKGEPLAGASVTVSFPDAGIRIVVAARSDGRFTVPNLRVGGPYQVIASHVNLESSGPDNIYLELGQNNFVEITLAEKITELSGITVTARGFDNKKTGASTNISGRLIRELPTIARSADDYLRLTPSASPTYNGMSFAGRNGQYNNFSLDGAVFNNPFGLDAPTPGGQTNAQPISLDAIDQIQVNLAPYDVTQAGFTGAGVNTVTKSGTNKFYGTVFGFYRNDALTGSKVSGSKLVIPSLSHLQTGFSLGGAIKKNKLFYFVNFETEQREDQATSYVAQNGSNIGQSNTSRVLESDLIAVSSILKQRFNYETGPYQDFTFKQKNYKWLAKLDWNINQIHKLTFIYNGLDASLDKPAHPSAIGRRGPDYYTLQFRNSGYKMVNKLNSFNLELKSNFNSKFANKLRLVYTSFRDHREPFSAPFPVINLTKNNQRYIIAGEEPFSINNILNQDAFQVTDNFNVFLNKHTLTFGASFESFKFGNSFNLTGYGPAIFWNADIQMFKDSVPGGHNYVFGGYPLDADVAYARNHAASGQFTWYYLTVGQIGAYVQDEWQISNRFRLTYGLRIDAPEYFNSHFKDPKLNGDGSFAGGYTEGRPTLPNNDNLKLFDANGTPVTNGVGKDIDNTRLPKKTPLFSPRVGFNYDIKGDKTIILRGGSGLFTGRFPFVWVGNQIGNPYSSFYCVTARDFKWPQVWRSNIGSDIRSSWGTIFTIDLAYTKDVHAMMVRNYGLGTPTGTLSSGTGDKRAVYLPANIGSTAYVFTNTNLGHSFNATFQAQQTFPKGFFGMFGYNYLVSKEASSVSAEISSDAFERNQVVGNANTAVVSNSLYGNKHRFLVAGTKRFSYGEDKMWGTTISFFASWTSGNRFSYTYNGDINNDGSLINDLLYVPTDAEINTMTFSNLTDANGNSQSPATQRAAFKAFIAQDKYLSSHRGQYTEKNGGQTPWFSQVDMRILQDLKIKTGKSFQTIQLSFDVVNLGNLINSKWGVRKYASTASYYQPLSVTNTGTTPTYIFDPSITSTFISSPELPSRWQMQFGLRYIF
ncbi:MAG: carboxypeptidase regulatory-like domain-containing protein [Bacteroidetes bacterium]|nr:carboxypeptidase regulatory-like domain-containing protein [Bacteroidota bacterium]